MVRVVEAKIDGSEPRPYTYECLFSDPLKIPIPFFRIGYWHRPFDRIVGNFQGCKEVPCGMDSFDFSEDFRWEPRVPKNKWTNAMKKHTLPNKKIRESFKTAYPGTTWDFHLKILYFEMCLTPQKTKSWFNWKSTQNELENRIWTIHLHFCFSMLVCQSHRESDGTLGMVPLIINPIYTLYNVYLYIGYMPF